MDETIIHARLMCSGGCWKNEFIFEATMKRIRTNITFIIKKSFQWTAAVFAFMGFIGTFAPLNHLINENIELWKRLLISTVILGIIWFVAFGVAAIITAVKRKYKVFEVNNHCVYIQYGDLLSRDEIKKEAQRQNIVIPANRCFDTLVDDDLISSNTLHGKAINYLTNKGYSQQQIDSLIQDSLKRQGLKYEILDIKDKRSGKLNRYPVGSVAELSESKECSFFFLGLTAFDDKLTATVTDEDYVLAIVRLLNFCNQRSQQYPVLMPLIGGGLSRTGKSERDILEFLIKLIELNKDLIQFDLHIVIRETGRDTIPIADI